MSQRYHSSCSVPRILSLLAGLLFVLALGGCGDAGTPSASTSTSSASIMTPTPASSGTETGGGASSTPTVTAATPTSQSADFQVTSLSVSVNHATFTGVCGSTITRKFTGVIHVPANTPGGTVTYHWIENGGGVFSTQTVQFAAGQTSATVTETSVTGANWGDGSQLWLALDVTAPNTLTSSHATFSFICQRKVTGITASVNPSTACTTANQTFVFNATIAVSPGPGSVTVTYHWVRSDGGTGSTTTVTIPDGQTSAAVTTSWSLFAPIQQGQDWEQVIVSSPDSATSNQATFSIIAC